MRLLQRVSLWRLSSSITISKYTLNLLLRERSLAKINTISRQNCFGDLDFSAKLQTSMRCHWMLSKKIVNTPIQRGILSTYKGTCRMEGFFLWDEQ